MYPPPLVATVLLVPGILTLVVSDMSKESPPPREEGGCVEKCWSVYAQNSFLVNVLVSILVAFLAPSVGLALAPAITASRVAVGIIFFLSGLGLKTRELVKALSNVKFNAFVQCFNMGVVTMAAFGVSRALLFARALSRDLADGVVICGALPMTVNMVIVLTKSANGDEAAAIFNSAFGNVLGIFVTPAWVVALLGESGSNDFGDVIRKLAERVLAPLFVGQLCQYLLPATAAFAKRHKKPLKRLQESCLVFIVYCVFCRRFRDTRRDNSDQENTTATDIVVVVVVQGCLLVAMMCLSWLSLRLAFPDAPKLRVMGLFGCTHKTVAAGVPLIDAIYSDDPARSLYILPLLVWHPAQLLLGSAVTTRLAAWVDAHQPKQLAAALRDQPDQAPDDLHPNPPDDHLPDHPHTHHDDPDTLDDDPSVSLAPDRAAAPTGPDDELPLAQV